MQHPEVQAFFHEPSHTFSYVAWDPATRKAAVIDAALDYDAASGRTAHETAQKIVAFVREHDGRRLLLAFNLSADAAEWRVPDAAALLDMPGVDAATLDAGVLRFPPRGAACASLD